MEKMDEQRAPNETPDAGTEKLSSAISATDRTAIEIGADPPAPGAKVEQAAASKSKRRGSRGDKQQTDGGEQQPASTFVSLDGSDKARMYLALSKALEPRSMSQTSHTMLVREGECLANRWRIIDQIGQGGFGQVFRAFDTQLQREVAVKVSPLRRRPTRGSARARQATVDSTAGKPNAEAAGNDAGWRPPDRLMTETHLLLKLRNSKHVPQVLGCGEAPPKFQFIVMEKLSRNLSELRRASPLRRLTRSTTFRVCAQMLNAIQDMHSVGYLHRDIKPSNMVLGLERQSCRTIYLIDFGLVRRYRDDSGCLRRPRPTAHLRGTPRYASLRVHLRLEQCRADDCCSWFYSLLDLVNGALPWRDKKGWTEIKLAKQNCDMDRECRYLPVSVRTLADRISQLDFADEPPYADFQLALSEATAAVGGKPDDPFDWEADFVPVREEVRRKVAPHGTRCDAQTAVCLSACKRSGHVNSQFI